MNCYSLQTSSRVSRHMRNFLVRLRLASIVVIKRLIDWLDWFIDGSIDRLTNSLPKRWYTANQRACLCITVSLYMMVENAGLDVAGLDNDGSDGDGRVYKTGLTVTQRTKTQRRLRNFRQRVSPAVSWVENQARTPFQRTAVIHFRISELLLFLLFLHFRRRVIRNCDALGLRRLLILRY